MPYVSDAQRRFFHSPGAKRAGLTSADVKHWDAASKGRKLPERVGKKKKKYKMSVDNKIKSYGWMDPKTNKIKINVKSHKGDKAELASTIKHEIMHVTHPKRTEKEVTKRTAKTKIPLQEQAQLLKKLHRATIHGREGALRKKYKIAPGKVEPGAIFNKAKEMSQKTAQQGDGMSLKKRVAFMGLV